MKKIVLNRVAIIVNCSLLIVNCSLLIVICSLPIANCQAQSLDSLLNQAVENNLELKIIQNDYLTLLEKADQVDQLPQPEANLGVFRPNSFMISGKRILSLSARQRIPWFGLLQQQKDIVLMEAKEYYQEKDLKKLDLIYQLETAYFQFYEKKKSELIFKRFLTLLASMEAAALAKVESGQGKLVEVIRIQLQQKEVEQQIKIFEVEQIPHIAVINQILNRPLNSAIVVDEDLKFIDFTFSKSETFEQIKSSYPLLKKYSIQENLVQERLQLNNLQNKPTLGFGFDYNLVNPFPNAQFENNGRDFFQFSVSAILPIYKKRFRAKKREENLKVHSIALMKEDVMDKISSEMEEWLSKIETLKLQFSLYEEQIKLTQSAIEMLNASYSISGNNFNEILLLEKELVSYDLKKLKAIVQSHIAKSNIDRFIVK